MMKDYPLTHKFPRILKRALLFAVTMAVTIPSSQSFVSRSLVPVRVVRLNTDLEMVLRPQQQVEENKAGANITTQQQQQQQQSRIHPGISSRDATTTRSPLMRRNQSLSSLHVEGGETQEQEEMSLWAARLILLLVAAIWGTNFASVKYLENLCFHPPCHHPPSEFAFARFGVAGLVSIPLLLGKRWDVILGGFECGLWITLGYVSQAMALATISSGKCAFICSLTVVFVPVVSAILYGRPIKRSDILAGLVAISGVAILEGMLDVPNLLGAAPAVAHEGTNLAASASAAATSSSVDIAAAGPIANLASNIGIDKGSLLALGQPVGFGFAFTRIEATQEKFKDVPDRVLTIAAAQCVSVGILSLLWVLYDYDGVIPNFGYMVEWHRIATILWTGIITTVVAIYLEGVALQKATATDASIAFSSEPVWASIFGYMLLGENLGLNAYVGGTVIMTACLIGALGDVSESNREDEMAP